MAQEFADREREIIEEFQSIISKLAEWGKSVDRTLLEILSPLIEAKKIQIFPKNRVKDTGSYMIKALYSRQYESPLEETEDKVGTRVVLLSSYDVIAAKSIIEKYGAWHSHIGNDYRDALDKTPDSFTYQSVHVIVRPLDEDQSYAGLSRLLTCEIQLRTLLQHAYAEISHDNIYKGAYKGDKEILRTLAKSMALMETTDDQFCRIFDMMNDDERPYRVYLKELVKLYKAFSPDFELDQSDIALNDTVLRLLIRKDVPLPSLRAFIEENNKFLRGGIRTKNGTLFQQPSILLIAFYLKRYEEFLRREWPLSHEALLNVFKSFGVSYGAY